MFTMTIATKNAAFEDGAATETGRILRLVAKAIEDGKLDGRVYDLNGNSVGTYKLDGS